MLCCGKELCLGVFDLVSLTMSSWSLPSVSDVLPPKRRADENIPSVLFLHGGGWVAPGTDVQLQQLTPIARSGVDIYLINYPLAPESPFPEAVLSTLVCFTLPTTITTHIVRKLV